MNIENVRITNITIQNFKNVVHGTLTLDNSKNGYSSCMLGLYGQNGSGKTALIDALELLQHALCGRPIPNNFADFINIDADTAAFVFEFRVGQHFVSYKFDIQGVLNDTEQNTQSVLGYGKKVRIFNELLKFRPVNDKTARFTKLIDTDCEDAFIPKIKMTLLTGKSYKDTDLLVAKKIAFMSSRSFVFSRELLTAIRTQAETNNNHDINLYSSLIESLVHFGNKCLFVINTTNSGLISLNTQTLLFKGENLRGTMLLQLNSPEVVSHSKKVLAEKLIQSMNIVLKHLVPGLTISVKDLGTQVTDSGELGNKIQLMSRGDKIPLKNESEGIKKIISVLQLLIVVYNQPSITVAIDELDSGIFEYLLGEILRLISENGKGQLIFTSHNLRPLETIDKNFGDILFVQVLYP